MIGYLLDQLTTLVLAPQAVVVDEELRAYVDPEARPLNVQAQEIDLAAVSTLITSESTGGSLELRHTIQAALGVEHGDAQEAARLRNAIVLDLALRFYATRGTLLAAVDPTSGQYGTRAALEVSYAPLAVVDGALVEWATLVFTIDTTLDL